MKTLPASYTSRSVAPQAQISDDRFLLRGKLHIPTLNTTTGGIQQTIVEIPKGNPAGNKRIETLLSHPLPSSKDKANDSRPPAATAIMPSASSFPSSFYFFPLPFPPVPICLFPSPALATSLPLPESGYHENPTKLSGEV